MDISAECSHSIMPSLLVPHSDVSRSNDDVQVDILALVMGSPSSDLSQTKTTNEELVAQRISKRAARKTEIHAKAESYKRMGDLLYESKNYKAAYPQYLEAIQVLGNVPEYYISLAAAYRKLTWNEEAAHAATRALTIDPKNLEARYVRGVARLEQRLLQAAQTDFESVLEHDQTHLRALAAISEVRQFLSQAELEDIQDNTIVDFGFPHWDYEALEVASMSDSSDCQHVGNGVPCRFYNHDGCGRGTECLYSHAPDEKSVRDDLGKNVCIYHILDSCKFGAARCVYSHSNEALPKRGWWNSPEKVAKVKEVLEVAETNAKEQRQAEMGRWRMYLKEMRGEVRIRHAKEKAKANVEQTLKTADLDEKKPGTKASKVPVDASNKKDATKKGVEEATEFGVVEGVKPEENSTRKTGAPSKSTVPNTKKAKARKVDKKKVIEPQGGHQKNTDGGASGAASTTPTTPSTKKRTRRFHHQRRRNSGTESAPGDPSSGAMVGAQA